MRAENVAQQPMRSAVARRRTLPRARPSAPCAAALQRCARHDGKKRKCRTEKKDAPRSPRRTAQCKRKHDADMQKQKGAQSASASSPWRVMQSVDAQRKTRVRAMKRPTVRDNATVQIISMTPAVAVQSAQRAECRCAVQCAICAPACPRSATARAECASFAMARASRDVSARKRFARKDAPPPPTSFPVAFRPKPRRCATHVDETRNAPARVARQNISPDARTRVRQQSSAGRRRRDENAEKRPSRHARMRRAAIMRSVARGARDARSVISLCHVREACVKSRDAQQARCCSPREVRPPMRTASTHHAAPAQECARLHCRCSSVRRCAKSEPLTSLLMLTRTFYP